jgi:hypothetical protein
MFWDPVAKMSVRTDNLRYHLAEPAQFSRILREFRMDVKYEGPRQWRASSEWDEPVIFGPICDTPEAAVRDAAALALRERT